MRTDADIQLVLNEQKCAHPYARWQTGGNTYSKG